MINKLPENVDRDTGTPANAGHVNAVLNKLDKNGKHQVAMYVIAAVVIVLLVVLIAR